MTLIADDIRSIPAILRQTYTRVAERRDTLIPFLDSPGSLPLVVLGCGSSYCVALSAAALYEQERQLPAQAILASDYVVRPGWTHIAISRTGQTTEVVEALQRVRKAGARSLLLTGEPHSPAARFAGETLLLDFAAEQGVIQTRFVAASLEALRLLLGTARARARGAVYDAPAYDLPQRVQEGLDRFDAGPLLRFDHAVFLGRGWRYGLARTAAINAQETTLLVAEGHQTLDYRHGPIAAADENTLVWSLDDPDDAASAAVLDDIRLTGATVHCGGDDPLVALAQSQMLALCKARARGIDPDEPRHLTRAVILT